MSVAAEIRIAPECGHRRPSWSPDVGTAYLACVLPRGHEGDHRNCLGHTWPQARSLPDPGRLLYGAVTPERAQRLCRLDGVFRLPETAIVLVGAGGLVRLMDASNGPMRWYGGRMELVIDGELIILWPVLDT